MRMGARGDRNFAEVRDALAAWQADLPVVLAARNLWLRILVEGSSSACG